MSRTSTPTRYGTVAIALHWTSAALIVAALTLGLVMTGQTDSAARATLLPVHILAGGTAFLLTIVRIGWWIWGDRRPAPVPNQPLVQLWAARLVHGALYLAILVLGASGIATLLLSGAIPALLSGASLPSFDGLAPRLAHGLTFRVLLVLLAAHVGAALYHQFIRRDRLLSRMGIG